MSSGFQITAAVLFTAAGMCLVAAVACFKAWNIREIRDTLTGKTAQKRIAELKHTSGRWNATNRRSSAEGSALESPWDASEIGKALDLSSLGVGSSTDMTNGSLHSVSDGSEDDAKDTETTLLVEEADAQQGTTLLANANSGSNEKSHEAQNVAAQQSAGKRDVPRTDEEQLGTTLLGEEQR